MLPDVIGRLNNKWQGKYKGRVRLRLHRWEPWATRYKLPLDDVGVYILAKYPSGPPPKVQPLAQEVVYFGETKPGVTTSLKKRLNDFDRTAFRGGTGHGGAENYKKAFPGDDGHDLYVAVCPVCWIPPAQPDDYSGLDSNPEFFVPKLVIPLETCFRGVYVMEWGRLPICNGK
ncbi:MAG: hypothetical protein HY673_05010 [Chloroflexi bacterium]|nr:hypothetical protein [Chloroflexota bacterium]